MNNVNPFAVIITSFSIMAIIVMLLYIVFLQPTYELRDECRDRGGELVDMFNGYKCSIDIQWSEEDQ